MIEEVLKDPYKQCKEVSRINADIATADKFLIQSICPVRGVLQAMTNMFFKAVVEECKSKGIKTYDDLSRFIEIVRRRTSPHTPNNDSGRDDRGGAARVRRGVPKRKNSKSTTA